MRRTKVSIKGTYKLAKSFLESKGFGQKVCKGECPPTYDTEPILTFFRRREGSPLTPLG